MNYQILDQSVTSVESSAQQEKIWRTMCRISTKALSVIYATKPLTPMRICCSTSPLTKLQRTLDALSVVKCSGGGQSIGAMQKRRMGRKLLK